MGCGGGKQGGGTGGGGGGIPGQPVPRAVYYKCHPGRRDPKAFRVQDPPLQPKIEGAKTEEEKQVLKVVNVDLNVAQNVTTHHTQKFSITQQKPDDGKKKAPAAQLVLRRGDPFLLTIKFDRAFEQQKDDVKLVFDIDYYHLSARESRGTRVVLPFATDGKQDEWSSKIVETKNEGITISVTTPPTCTVAKWRFRLELAIKKDDKSKTFRYDYADPFYIIFNPWHPNDPVYMEDAESRMEYVLNDSGRIYRGTKTQISAKPWNFAQFEDIVLDVCMYLLDKSELEIQLRRDPVLVSRKLTSIINAPDDRGLLVGDWSGSYPGGKSPLNWIGSLSILQQAWKTHLPVKYGQCYIVSAIAVTIFRALGIPCRSVTNFLSAHDNCGVLSIDSHWSSDGKPLDDHNLDSIWSFHSWNEVWMTRPDLPPGFGGWQAVDATPQATVDGVISTGPTSVEAVKNGLVQLPYDGLFVFAEINANRLYWIKKPDGTWTQTKEAHSTGKLISTKSPLYDLRMDITNLYKFPEGSHQEKTALWRAEHDSSSRSIATPTGIQDMRFELIGNEGAMYGEDFDVKVKVQNDSPQSRTVNVTITATAIHYTGVPIRVIKSENQKVTAPSRASVEAALKVTWANYTGRLGDQCHIKVGCLAHVTETNRFYCLEDQFRLRKPELTIKVPPEVKVDQEIEVEISLKNILPVPLSKSEFILEVPSFPNPIHLKYGKDIPAQGEAKVSTKLKIKQPGDKELIASFICKDLIDVVGKEVVRVLPLAS